MDEAIYNSASLNIIQGLHREIDRLRAENAELRNQLAQARSYAPMGQQYPPTGIHDPSPAGIRWATGHDFLDNPID